MKRMMTLTNTQTQMTPRSNIAMCLVLALLFFQIAVVFRTQAEDAEAGNAGAQPRLDQVLSINLTTLAATPGKTWNYVPSATGLGTNQAVWTWPVNLSCVGSASDFYQATLIAPDKLLTCGHYGGEVGKIVQFHDTNGVPWTGHVAKVVNVAGDLCISYLSNSAPDSIVIPAIFPPDAADYLPNHSLRGLPALWLHRNGTNSGVGGTIQRSGGAGWQF